MSSGVLERLDAVAQRLAVERTLQQLARDAEPIPAPPKAQPGPAAPVPTYTSRPPVTVQEPPRPRAPRPALKRRREIDWSAFGAKGLAVAGGVVTVLGIVFFALSSSWRRRSARATSRSTSSAATRR